MTLDFSVFYSALSDLTWTDYPVFLFFALIVTFIDSLLNSD